VNVHEDRRPACQVAGLGPVQIRIEAVATYTISIFLNLQLHKKD
jgi:hypothetical protein